MESLDAKVEQWLSDNGHDLSAANEIHAQAMRRFARNQVIADAAKPKKVEQAEAKPAEQSIQRKAKG